MHAHLYMPHTVSCCMLYSGTFMIFPGLTVITSGHPNDPLFLPGSNTCSTWFSASPRVRHMDNGLFQQAVYISEDQATISECLFLHPGSNNNVPRIYISPRVKQQYPNILFFLPGSNKDPNIFLFLPGSNTRLLGCSNGQATCFKVDHTTIDMTNLFWDVPWGQSR